MKQANPTLDFVLPLAPAPAVSRALWITIFALLTAAAARVQIPLWPVPVTLQATAVVLAGALLGPVAGAASQVIYLALGASGWPVFAQGGGAAYLLLSPTTGYLLAFPVAAALTGVLLRAGSLARWRLLSRALVAVAAGTALILAVGTFHLRLVLGLGWPQAWTAGGLVFLASEAVKVAAAALLAGALLGKQRA